MEDRKNKYTMLPNALLLTKLVMLILSIPSVREEYVNLTIRCM